MTQPTSSADQHRAEAPRSIRAAVVTISDTRTPETDESGRYLAERLTAAGHTVVERVIVQDDAVQIRTAVVRLMRVCEVVLTTGGTGITGRDVTVPAIESLLTKPIPGFGELFRMLSYGHVRGAAMLSRAIGGVGRGALVFAMPGSLNAVKTAWEGILADELGHLVYEMIRQGQVGHPQPAMHAHGPAAPTPPNPTATPAPEAASPLSETQPSAVAPLSAGQVEGTPHQGAEHHEPEHPHALHVKLGRHG